MVDVSAVVLLPLDEQVAPQDKFIQQRLLLLYELLLERAILGVQQDVLRVDVPESFRQEQRVDHHLSTMLDGDFRTCLQFNDCFVLLACFALQEDSGVNLGFDPISLRVEFLLQCYQSIASVLHQHLVDPFCDVCGCLSRIDFHFFL